MNKFFKRFGYSLGVLLLVSVLVACGEDTPTSPQATATSTSQATPLLATAAPATATTAPFTAAPFTAAPTPTVAATATSIPVPVTTISDAALQNLAPVVGELPAPPAARKLNFTLDMLKNLQKRLGGRPAALDLSGLRVGAYAATGQPADTFDFYRAVMRAKGWTESHAYNNLYGIYFEKEGQVALVTAVGVPDDTTLAFLAGFVPEVRGQLKSGEVLVLLGQGPESVFEIVKK